LNQKNKDESKMKCRLLVCGFVLGSVTALLGGHALSQDDSDMDPAQMQRMMQLAEKLATPGEAHKRLDYFVGEWDTSTIVMGMPSEAGTQSIKWILGGRQLQSDVNGTLMGRPFEGFGLLGYDNYKKKYTSVWCDSQSTTLLTSEGLADQSGKVITLYGTMDEWMNDTHDKAVKYVYRIVDEDTYEFEIHDLGIVPGDTKVISMTATRKK